MVEPKRSNHWMTLKRDEEGNFLTANPVLQENFFDVVRDDILYTTSAGSTVEDFIGKNENGNFVTIRLYKKTNDPAAPFAAVE